MHFYLENTTTFGEILLTLCDSRVQKGCTSHRSRQELSNEDPYSNEDMVPKIGVDTSENELLKVHLLLKLWDSIFRRPAPALSHPQTKSMGRPLSRIEAQTKPCWEKRTPAEPYADGWR